jgi:hypothetical protein
MDGRYGSQTTRQKRIQSGQSGEGKNKIIIRRAVKRRGRGGKMKTRDMLLI